MWLDPETYLRNLSDELWRRLRRPPEWFSDHPDELLVNSSAVQAVANAFVVLDLLDEAQAEEVLLDHRRRLETSGIELDGVKTGELTLVPASGHRIAERRVPSPEDFAERPLAVAVPRARLGNVELHNLVLTAAGLRGQLSVHDFTPAPSGSDRTVPGVSLIDDRGNSQGLTATVSHAISGRWRGFRVAHFEVRIDNPEIARSAWFDLSVSGVESPLRVQFDLPPARPVGVVEDRPAPAERYLEWLMPGVDPTDPSAQIGVGLTARQAFEIAVTVADALLAVGALPRDSPLLDQPRPRSCRWSLELAGRWARRSRDTGAFGDVDVIALGNELPFERAVVAIESFTVANGVALAKVFARPRPRGEYWPVAVSGFRVSAIDDLGVEHVAAARAARLGDVLWPPLSPQVRRLRVHVSSLWEEAWIELDLPST